MSRSNSLENSSPFSSVYITMSYHNMLSASFVPLLKPIGAYRRERLSRKYQVFSCGTVPKRMWVYKYHQIWFRERIQINTRVEHKLENVANDVTTF